nr:hypothetical protein [Tanacetum cinerariifolium]
MKRIKNNHTEMHCFTSYLIFSLLPCYLLQATLTTGSNTVVSDGEITRIAKELIDEKKVKAILGGHTWEEVSAIAEQKNLLMKKSESHTRRSYMGRSICHSRGSMLTHILPLACSLDEELELLKRQQRQVFLIHTSLELGARLFQTAKKMEMTGYGYLWISSNQITDIFHSINSTMTSSLEGLFQSDYPGEDQDEPGTFAVQGYNTGRLLENLDNQITLRESNTVKIDNVIGNGYHNVYWTQGLGNLVESSKTQMMVGVPVRSLFTQFLSVDFDSKTNQSVFSGFSEQKFDVVVGEALNSREIATLFLEVPLAKIFLARYCKSFIETGKTFKVGGYGFAFHTGFPRLLDANKALMKVLETGKLKELEDTFLSSEKCVDEQSSTDEKESLSPKSFYVVFMLTLGTSTIALILHTIKGGIRSNKYLIKNMYSFFHSDTMSSLASLEYISCNFLHL